MEVITKRITLEDVTQPLRIIPLGDIHIGNINVDINKLKGTIEYIKNTPNTYTILMGDYCEAILTQDKRFDIRSLDTAFRNRIDDLAFAQFEYIKELLLPIKDKILLGIRGGHEDVLRTRYNTDFAGWLFKELKAPLAGYSAFLKIKFDRAQFHTEEIVIFVHHGFMSSRRTGAKVNAIEDLASSFDANIYLLGHSHDLFVTSKVKLSVAGTHIKEKKLYFANTGTFLKTYVEGNMNYGERVAYPPLKTGVIKFSIYPSSAGIDIHASE